MKPSTKKVATASKELDLLIEAYTDMGYSLAVSTWMAKEGIKDAMGGTNESVKRG